MRRAYSYVRFSKKAQANGDSLRRQLEGTRAYCQRKGLLLDDGLNLHDLGMSAFRGKNAEVGALAQFLEAVRLGRVAPGSILIIESLDRLSRKAIDEAYDLFREILAAGIDITTLQPERDYTKESLKDIVGLLEPLFIMSRAHEESATKSARIKAAWEVKRSRMSEKRASVLCPAWLRPAPDGNGFIANPAAAEAVRRIFRMAREGYGTNAIAQRLNAEGVPPIGRKAPFWRRGYVNKILASRAVLGEHHPHVMRDGKRVPEGKTVAGYFPVIITEPEWHATRLAVGRRFRQRGRQGKRVRSLFTGILFDARDGRSMIVRSKGYGRPTPYLISSGAIDGAPGSAYGGFPYEVFEGWLIDWLHADLVTGLVRRGPDGHEQLMATLTADLTDLDYRMKVIQKRVETEANFEPLLDVLATLSERKKLASESLDRLKQEQTCNDAETLGEARSIHQLLKEAGEAELFDLRTRLKARLRALLREVWMLIEGPRQGKWATVQLHFRRGTWMQFTGSQLHGPTFGRGGLEETLEEGMDLRKWRFQTDKVSFSPPDALPSIVTGGTAWETLRGD